MKRLALIDGSGAVVNMTVLDNGADWSAPDGLTAVDGDGAAIGDTWDGTKFVSPPPPVVPPKTVFGGAEFLGRLTDDEYSAIIAASAKSVQIARWLDIFRLRGEIDVTGSTAQAAKVGLVATGLLTQERADVIFASG